MVDRQGLSNFAERLLRYDIRNGSAEYSTDEERAVVKWVVGDEADKHGIENFELCDTFAIAPYVYKLVIPICNSEDGTARASNGIFHRLGLLAKDENLAVGSASRYCQIGRYDGFYLVIFNEPSATKDEYGFHRLILQNYRVGGRLTKHINSYVRFLTRRKGKGDSAE